MSIAGKAAVSHDYEAKNGNLLKSTYANGWEVAYTYDNLDRVTEVKAAKDGTSYTIGRYIYDKLGRVARFIDGQVSEKSCTYGYDLTDRLCEAVFDDGTAYRYTYDANDCLVKEVQTTPDGVRTVTRGYDADSRETSVACGSVRIEKTFDKLGRLSSIRRNGGKHTTTYIYETAADGGQTGRIKTVKNGSGQLMAIRYKGADYYYIRDGLMTITGLVDANGAAVVNYRYDSWGMLTGISGSMAGTLGKDNPYRFKGYYYDEETGMYYLKSRYYQPEICRFISADDENVLNIEQGNLNQFNLYLYCLNNSVNRVDETGNISVSALLRGLGNAFTGFSAIGIGATVIACGVATPVMLGIAVATVAVGVLTTVNGASDLGEAFTGKNVVKDVVFNGNTKKYNTYSAAVATAATIGTTVCGGWVAKNIPRIKAYNNVQNYKYTKTISDAKHMRRVYNNSTLIQKQIIKYGKMQKDSFGYVFSVKGNVNGRTAVWRLGINVKRKMVWHFGHGF